MGYIIAVMISSQEREVEIEGGGGRKRGTVGLSVLVITRIRWSNETSIIVQTFVRRSIW